MIYQTTARSLFVRRRQSPDVVMWRREWLRKTEAAHANWAKCEERALRRVQP